MQSGVTDNLINELRLNLNARKYIIYAPTSKNGAPTSMNVAPTSKNVAPGSINVAPGSILNPVITDFLHRKQCQLLDPGNWA